MGGRSICSISLANPDGIVRVHQRDAGGPRHADREPQGRELPAQVGEVDLQGLGAHVHLVPHAGADLGAPQAARRGAHEQREDLELLGRECVGAESAPADREAHRVDLETGRRRHASLQEARDAFDLDPQLRPTRRGREVLRGAEGVALADQRKVVHPAHGDPRLGGGSGRQVAKRGEDRLPVGSQVRDPEQPAGRRMPPLERREPGERREEAQRMVGPEGLLVAFPGVSRVQDADRRRSEVHVPPSHPPRRAILGSHPE